jgi:hypothetical protein
MKKLITTIAVALVVAISANAKVHESKATCLRELGSIEVAKTAVEADKTVNGHRIVVRGRANNFVAYVFDRTDRYAIVELFKGKISSRMAQSIARRYATDWRVIDQKDGLYYSDSTRLYLEYSANVVGVFDSEGKRFLLSKVVRDLGGPGPATAP